MPVAHVVLLKGCPGCSSLTDRSHLHRLGLQVIPFRSLQGRHVYLAYLVLHHISSVCGMPADLLSYGVAGVNWDS